MEHNSSDVVISGSTVNTLNKNQKGQNNGFSPKKKKRGPMHIIKVALYMLKGKSKKSKPASLEAACVWQKFSGLNSMRPLHVQMDPQSPRQLTESAADVVPVFKNPVVEHFEVFTPPMSPAQASEPMSPAQASVVSSFSYGTSRYASASNLQELDDVDEIDEEDDGEEEEEVGGYGDKGGGDEMIDAKAEQFIAQFYQQMRLQHEAYNNHRRRRPMDGGQ